MRRFLSPVVSFVCLAALTEPALAAATAAPLVVTTASADGGILTIRGVGFGTAAPYVALAGVPLVVLSSSGGTARRLRSSWAR